MSALTPDEMKALAMDAAWAQFTRMPSSNPGDIVHAVFDAIGPALEAALSAHPAEETEWEYGISWDKNYAIWVDEDQDESRVRAEHEDNGGKLMRRPVGPWSPVPDGSET